MRLTTEDVGESLIRVVDQDTFRVVEPEAVIVVRVLLWGYWVITVNGHILDHSTLNRIKAPPANSRNLRTVTIQGFELVRG